MQRRQQSRLLARLVVLDFGKPEDDVPWRLIPTPLVWLRIPSQFKECDQIRTMLEEWCWWDHSWIGATSTFIDLWIRLNAFIFSCRCALLWDWEDMPRRGMADDFRRESGFPWDGHWRCRVSWVSYLHHCSKQSHGRKAISITAHLARCLSERVRGCGLFGHRPKYRCKGSGLLD